MKYTALLMILSGVVLACFAGVRYATDGPPEWAENPFVLGLVLPMVFAAALVTTGTGLWAFGGRPPFRARLPVATRPGRPVVA